MTTAAELLEALYADGEVEGADGSRRSIHPAAVPREDALAIARLVREQGATRTLETGLAWGLSALAICAVHQERGTGSHVAIDPDQSGVFASAGALNLRRAGVGDRVRVIEEPADRALPRLRDEGLRLDLAFIDGHHMFDFALLDFFYVDQMLEVGGVVVFHDSWMAPIAPAVAYVRRNRAYEVIRSHSLGMSALRKVRDDSRPWDFHRGFALDPIVARGALVRFARRRRPLVRRLRGRALARRSSRA